MLIIRPDFLVAVVLDEDTEPTVIHQTDDCDAAVERAQCVSEKAFRIRETNGKVIVRLEIFLSDPKIPSVTWDLFTRKWIEGRGWQEHDYRQYVRKRYAPDMLHSVFGLTLA